MVGSGYDLLLVCTGVGLASVTTSSSSGAAARRSGSSAVLVVSSVGPGGGKSRARTGVKLNTPSSLSSGSTVLGAGSWTANSTVPSEGGVKLDSIEASTTLAKERLRERARRGSAHAQEPGCSEAAEQGDGHEGKHGVPDGLLQALVGQDGEEGRWCCSCG